MGRPESYKYSYIALHNIPYVAGTGTEFADTVDGSCGGVVGAGQVVWADHLHQRQPARVTAFLDSVGVVSLDPRWLVPPELYQNARR